MLKLFLIFIVIVVNHSNASNSSGFYKFEASKYLASSWTPHKTVGNTKTHIQCSLHCVKDKVCSALRFIKDTGNCELGSKLSLLSAYPDYPTEKVVQIFANDRDPKILMVGGYNYGFKNDVDLYDPKLNKTCKLRPMTVATTLFPAAYFGGSPIICGGKLPSWTYTANCYLYTGSTNTWSQINSLVTATSMASTVVIPNRGFYIFGGSSLTRPQRLTSLTGNWIESPPDPFKPNSAQGTCILQLDLTTTVFLGGDVLRTSILTLDWSTMAYTKQPAQFQRSRIASTCSFVRKSSGPVLVAVAGGDTSTGLEIWNPTDNSVQLAADKMPQEELYNAPLTRSNMISINDHTELLFMGGSANNVMIPSIYKFNYEQNIWSNVGPLLTPRMEASAFLVEGINCP